LLSVCHIFSSFTADWTAVMKSLELLPTTGARDVLPGERRRFESRNNAPLERLRNWDMLPTGVERG
jgi:hypothetical protein